MHPTAASHPTAVEPSDHAGAAEERPPASLERAVLATALYSDLFDYPLTDDELYRYLVVPCPDRAAFDRALAALEGRHLVRSGGYLCRAGREQTAEIRQRRRALAARRWPPARRFARWLARVPFLRMVAVCGSQAVENGDRDGDVDLFLVTEPDRLWLVQAATMVLRRAGRLLGVRLCPNYLLTTDALEIESRDLYTAREIAQAVPLWGGEVYERFLEANRWIEDFLPQIRLEDRRRLLEPRARPFLTGVLARLLGGRLGHLLDRAVHRALLLYYRLRLRRHGWSKEDVERAYRPDRQVVITGGYAAAVAERFLASGRDGLLTRGELERWFYGAVPPVAKAAPDPLYAGLLDRRYGAAGD